MDKQEVARILEDIGILLELKGENPFKVRAYLHAARAIEGVEGDLSQWVLQGTLENIKGIGKALAEKITELVQTGRLDYYEELKNTVPKGLLRMLSIPGMGPKKVQAVYQKLHIKDVDGLEKACRESQLTSLDGFGEKTQEKILQGIEFIRKNEERHLYDIALAEAELILEVLNQDPRVQRISVAGSLRRHKELVKDVDMVASAREEDAPALMDFFSTLPQVERVVAKGPTKTSVLLKSGINADFRIVRDQEYPYALLHFTGSAEHNTAMRSRAKSRKMKLNEYGLYQEDEILIRCKNEEAIFKALGLSFIPPELRENQGEIEAAEKGEIPKLVSVEDIQGIFHVHSHWSDGKTELKDMIRACSKRGYKYIGIAEHSRSAFYAHGLDEERVKEQHREIDRLQKEFGAIRIFKGIEVEILPDGSLDYDEAIWRLFDFMIASVHAKFNMNEKEMTERIIKAMDNPYVTMLGHPTGRLLLEREPYPVNIDRVIEAAGERGTIIELNANPHRFDLDWRRCPYAKSRGVRISINPDAHSLEGLDVMPFGVGIARKGWLESEDVFNTLDVSKIELFFKQRKEKANKNSKSY